MTQGTDENRDLEKSLPQSGSSGITPIPAGSAPLQSTLSAEPQFSHFIRISSGAFCLFLIAGFLLAANLSPSPRGYGTHQQLGLPPCSIQVLFGIPCPSCGMTTSFCWFVRGEILKSAQANLAGLYLATICALLLPILAAISLWDRLIWIKKPLYWAVVSSSLYFVIALAQWGVRYFFAAY